MSDIVERFEQREGFWTVAVEGADFADVKQRASELGDLHSRFQRAQCRKGLDGNRIIELSFAGTLPSNIVQAEITRLREENARLRELVGYVLQDDLNNRLTPRVVDVAYTAFMAGRTGENPDDGGPCDWFNDTKPTVMRAIEKMRKDLLPRAALQETPDPMQTLADLGQEYDNG